MRLANALCRYVEMASGAGPGFHGHRGGGWAPPREPEPDEPLTLGF